MDRLPSFEGDDERDSTKTISCPKCDGLQKNTCTGCLGRGKIDADYQRCPICKGSGTLEEKSCFSCHSFGYVSKLYAVCSNCKGQGHKNTKNGLVKLCDVCFGNGLFIDLSLYSATDQ